jgi:hypothetical protein
MARFTKLLLIVVLVAPAACFHATVETGLAPSTTVIDKSWASGWIYGLVPPSTVETASKCPSGVAKVETERSFLTAFVGLLTGGIYTPMAIKVTCAQSGHASLSPAAPAIDVRVNPTVEEMQSAIRRAADLSLRDGAPAYVQY